MRGRRVRSACMPRRRSARVLSSAPPGVPLGPGVVLPPGVPLPPGPVVNAMGPSPPLYVSLSAVLWVVLCAVPIRTRLRTGARVGVAVSVPVRGAAGRWCAALSESHERVRQLLPARPLLGLFMDEQSRRAAGHQLHVRLARADQERVLAGSLPDLPH